MKNSLKNTPEVVPGNVNLRNIPGIVNNPRKVPSIGLKSTGLKSEESSFEINHITSAGLSSNKINNINNNNNNSNINNNSNNNNNLSNVDQTNSAGYVNKLPSSSSSGGGGGGGVSTANGRPSLPQVNILKYYRFCFRYFYKYYRYCYHQCHCEFHYFYFCCFFIIIDIYMYCFLFI
jgi:hypothetical protein